MNHDETWMMRHRFHIIVAILTVIGAGIRLRGLDNQSFWVDELYSLNRVMRPTWEQAMLGSQSMFGIDNWIFFYLAKFTGYSDYALRSISAWAGILTIPTIAYLGRRLHGDAAGIIASSLFVGSYSAFIYAQEFRPYSLPTLMIWFAFLMLLNRDDKKMHTGTEIGISLIFCLCFLIHYLAGLVCLLGLCVLCIRDSVASITGSDGDQSFGIRSIRNLFTYHSFRIAIPLVFTMMIVLPTMLTDSASTEHSNWIPETPEDPQLYILNLFLGWGGGGSWKYIAWFAVMISPLLLIATIMQRRERIKNILNHPEWFLWATALGSFGAIILYSELVRPLFLMRYLYFSMPGWFLLMGITSGRLLELGFNKKEHDADRSVSSFITAIIIALIISSSMTIWLVDEHKIHTIQSKSDFKGMSQDLNLMELPDDVLIVSAPTAFHWNDYLLRMNSDVRVDYGAWAAVPPDAYAEVNHSNPSMVILLAGHGPEKFYDDNFVEFLNGTYEIFEERTYVKGRITVFERVVL